MDEVRNIKDIKELIELINRAKENLSPDFLLIILGPTASGKTKMAVQLAQMLQGEIISADSRQVYKGLDIGTGKDLIEYQGIPYHLIDIRNPEDLYNVEHFKSDFQKAYDQILKQGKIPILCGGTGSYIQSILQEQPYSQIPKDTEFQKQLSLRTKEELIEEIHSFQIPEDFKIDWNSHKRLVRAVEILRYLQENPALERKSSMIKQYLILGLNPLLERRREKIDQRLSLRLEEGLLQEVQDLLDKGIDHSLLQWYGLEYKYASLYLLGEMTEEEFYKKLKTEIHRFAKRQMTYFRKMEKDGIKIAWINLE